MGNANSEEEEIDHLSDDLIRHARSLSELATLTYEEFQNYLTRLNVLSQKCMDAQGNQLVFAVKKGTDSSVFWKGTVRIACVKLDPETKKIEAYRLLNLNQFLRVVEVTMTQLNLSLYFHFPKIQQGLTHGLEQYIANHPEEIFRSLNSQFVAAQGTACATEASTSDEGSFKRPTLAPNMTTSMLFNHIVNEKNECEKLAECCICLERTPDVMLPCAHSYCRPCIEQWSVNHKTCPMCRDQMDSCDDAWVISEAPNSLEISEEICSSLMELVSRQSSVDDEDDSTS